MTLSGRGLLKLLEKSEDYGEYMDMQMELNTNIFIKHGIEFGSKKLENKLELIDEICELMNKTRIHKYWSTKGMESKKVLLDEYVDIWHMAFTIGNDLEIPGGHYGIEIKKDLLNQFDTLFFAARTTYNPIGWHCFISQLKGLGLLLNFTSEEVKEAFKHKWSVNMQRQKEGY